MLPQVIFRNQRLLLRPFWDGSRAVVAVYATMAHSVIVSNFWLPMYAFAELPFNIHNYTSASLLSFSINNYP